MRGYRPSYFSVDEEQDVEQRVEALRAVRTSRAVKYRVRAASGLPLFEETPAARKSRRSAKLDPPQA